MTARAAAFLLAAALLSPAPRAGAIAFQRTNLVVQAASEPFEQLAFVLGGRVELAGGGRDDVFVVGSDLTLSGAFDNDLWALGDSVTLSGTVSDHARLLGKVVLVSGTVENGLAAGGGTVKLDTAAHVRDGAMIAGEDVIAEGRVEGGLTIIAQRVTLGGAFEGDVQVTAADIVVLPRTVIDGDFTYTTGEPLALDPRVKISGRTIRREPAEPSAGLGAALQFQGMLYLAALLSALPFVAIFPRATGEAVRLLRHAAWKCALAGAIAFGLLPILVVLCLLTVLGIPLGLALAACYALVCWFAQAVVAILAGSILMRRRGPQPFGSVIAALAIGLLLLYLLGLAPGFSTVVGFAVIILGGGALLLSIGARQRTAAPVAAATPPPVPPTDGE